ncbi:sulfatase [Altericroceibacterium endophyticum]|uniref:Sulfatase-like hydrolase/transferase n=1 Tax=Altericroceibacterium endophyticum TaxID=1808508 RepID=A0A6I4T7S9_9SPHN|nr:sulfatase-like hydrolase/transferase [Altericroceibacterium endophyticum]MXO66151.1 sulfatase-like hydrolase/transferase [Altericroceibacterium endophyticum]
MNSDWPGTLTRRGAIAGALGTAALSVAAPALARHQGKKPNFLFIMADDLGYSDLSCYGRKDYKTPNLDRLAGEGMRFTHAYANSAVCSATRTALLTGRYQYRLPVGLEEPLGQRNVGMPPGFPTLPSLLKDRGYISSLIGKWHLGGMPEYGPLKSGYDEFWGIRSGGVDYFTHKYFGQKDLWDGETPVEEAGYLTELLTDRALETLDARAQDQQPFLLSLHYTAPHWPWEGPEDQAESKRLDESENPVAIMDYDGGDMETYAAMVTALDSQVGRVLEHLKQRGLADNTVVVFTSDNGGERFSDVWPFTGRKTELLEGGLRIPTIVRWPGVTQPGTQSDQPIMSMDWLPTFMAAAGTEPNRRYPSDGQDIRPALRGEELPERTLFWRFKNHGQQAARQGRYKYLEIGGNSFLFDVVADPLERANLKERMPDIYAGLKQQWAKWDADMLHDPNASSYGFTGKVLADHYGIDS